MNKKSVVIAGGTGLVGKFLTSRLDKNQYDIFVLTRTPKPSRENVHFVAWDPSRQYIHDSLQKADIIINLAGEGIAEERWTEQRKLSLLESRTSSAATLKNWIERNNIRPELYIGASAVGYYGNRGDEVLAEESAAGKEFMSDICQQWENATWQMQALVNRMIILRIGIVLSPDGGALPKMLMTKPFGFLTYFGDGRQYYPWVHMEDLYQIIIHAIENQNYTGVINAVAPQQIDNRTAMYDLKKYLHNVWFVFPVPALLLKVLLGEMSKVVMNSNRVVPTKLIDLHFPFKHTDFAQAVISFDKVKK